VAPPSVRRWVVPLISRPLSTAFSSVVVTLTGSVPGYVHLQFVLGARPAGRSSPP
jgi:hypothetical protein